MTSRDGTNQSRASDLRVGLTLWLEYQRHEFQRKWRDLDPGQLAAWSVPPVELSVLGLIRHMQQMEHGYLSWGLGGGDRIETYGDDDYAGGSVDIGRGGRASATSTRLDGPTLRSRRCRHSRRPGTGTGDHSATR